MKYLPIVIGQRRLHVCHLNNNKNAQAVFEFIVPTAGGETELFKIDGRSKFVSMDGLELLSDSEKYRVDPINENGDGNELSLKIIFGHVAAEQDYNNKNGISVTRAHKDRSLRAISTRAKINKLKVNIVYCERVKQGNEYEVVEYCYNIIIHIPYSQAANIDIYDAAIDFGSEASQIGTKLANSENNAQDVKIVRELKQFHDQYIADKRDRFWQGDAADRNPETSCFYKSVFFVDKAHNGFRPAEPPNARKEKTLLKTLLPEETAYTTEQYEQGNIYSNLFLLPNLKLIELLTERDLGMADDIPFKQEQDTGDYGFGKARSVFDPVLIEVYIRMILNALLHTILNKLNDQPQKDKYVNIILLVPNVYSQSKVYTIIQNLYTDFNGIVRFNKQYQKFKGVEVKLLSESDASFLGLKIGDREPKIINKEGAHYLVIDAGKGTTDFSIIRQQKKSNVSYESVFRAGLPGSGQFLTHAFIEAVNECFDFDTDIYDLIKKTKYPEILQFMDHMETFKKNHERFKPYKDSGELRKKFSTLYHLNNALRDTFINNCFQLPTSHEKLSEKVNKLVDEIYKSVLKSNVTEFHQIILAGRAFKLKMLKDAVESKFADKLTTDLPEDKRIVFRENNLKQVCLSGAFYMKYFRVNYNSELVGIPVQYAENIENKKEEKPWNFGDWLRGIFKEDENTGIVETDVSIGESFFYNGANYNGANYANRLVIAGREYWNAALDSDPEGFRLFFTGDGFIKLLNGRAVRLDAPQLEASISEMVKQTLFPFAYISFDPKSGPAPDGPEKEVPIPSQPPTSPSTPTHGQAAQARNQEKPDFAKKTGLPDYDSPPEKSLKPDTAEKWLSPLVSPDVPKEQKVTEPNPESKPPLPALDDDSEKDEVAPKKQPGKSNEPPPSADAYL